MIGQLDQALADSNESLRLKGDPYTLDSRGLVYLKLGRFDPAIADYTAVLKQVPDFADSLTAAALPGEREAMPPEARPTSPRRKRCDVMSQNSPNTV